MTTQLTKKVISKHLIWLILLIATVLRLWNLGSIPPHLTPDEAALGYNSYSILKTGKDEHGITLPIIFESFGDWKPGLYIYAAIPFVATLGLTEFAVRLPSALAGIVAVWLLYKIIIDGQLLILNKDKKNIKSIINNQSLAIIASFLLTVSPWHIHFSRGAWEANLALTLTLAGIYFFLISMDRSRNGWNMDRSRNGRKARPVLLLVSSFFFALTFVAYQGAKLSSTIVVSILIITYRNECGELVKNHFKSVVQSTVLGILIVSPVLLSLISGKAGRLQVFSAFSYTRPTEYVQGILNQGSESINSLSYYLFHSEFLYHIREVAGHWFNHFSGRFLFFEGDWQNTRHTAPNSGVMLISDLLFLPLGIVYLLKSKNTKLKNFMLVWLLLAPLPSALSRDSVHAVRALNTVIPLTIVSTAGVYFTTLILKSIRYNLVKLTLSLFVVVGIIGSLIYYFDSYFVHLPVHTANDWFYGYREAVYDVTSFQNDYENILFVQSYAQPYIYFLFYQKYSPVKWQEQANIYYENVNDVGLVPRIDNIRFEGFAWPAPAVKGDLVIGSTVDIPNYFADQGFRLIKEIKQPNGNPAFRIVEKII